jgi:hypothetical protein
MTPIMLLSAAHSGGCVSSMEEEMFQPASVKSVPNDLLTERASQSEVVFGWRLIIIGTARIARKLVTWPDRRGSSCSDVLNRSGKPENHKPHFNSYG